MTGILVKSIFLHSLKLNKTRVVYIGKTTDQKLITVTHSNHTQPHSALTADSTDYMMTH